jgi:hypothetical protein
LLLPSLGFGQVCGYERFQETPHQRTNLSLRSKANCFGFFDAVRFPRAASEMRLFSGRFARLVQKYGRVIQNQ